MDYQVHCTVSIFFLSLHRPSTAVRLELCIVRCTSGSEHSTRTPRYTSAALKPDGVVCRPPPALNRPIIWSERRPLLRVPPLLVLSSPEPVHRQEPLQSRDKSERSVPSPRCHIGSRLRLSQTGFHADRLAKRRRRTRQSCQIFWPPSARRSFLGSLKRSGVRLSLWRNCCVGSIDSQTKRCPWCRRIADDFALAHAWRLCDEYLRACIRFLLLAVWPRDFVVLTSCIVYVELYPSVGARFSLR